MLRINSVEGERVRGRRKPEGKMIGLICKRGGDRGAKRN
jgi:hypothetical protein